MTPASPYGPLPMSPAARSARAGDRYLLGLGVVLLGYALFSRPFAYLGVPPLFIGEIMLALGLWAAWRYGALREALRQGPVRWLAVFMAWGLACTLPYVPTYGLDALRDAVLWGYGLFGVIVAALVLRSPDRLRQMLLRYRVFVWAFLGLIGVIYILNAYFRPLIPHFPGAPNVPLIEAKGGDILVHLAGVTVFLVVGMMRMRWGIIGMLAATLGIVLISNRGGMVAFAMAGLVLLAMKPPGRSVGKMAAGFTFLMLVFLLAGSLMTIHSGREISAEQLWTNVQSIAGGSGEGALDGTRRWRLSWWEDIVGYTFGGPYFLTGKGFGINLASADGYQVDAEELVRSPHNGHMTVLARMGVPGVALWALVHGSWLLLMLRGWLRSRRERDDGWTSIYTFIVAYWVASLVNASFDVYLEGPVGGIWLWCIWGFGLGAAYVHRHTPEVGRDASPPAIPAGEGLPAAESVPWQSPARSAPAPTAV